MMKLRQHAKSLIFRVVMLLVMVMLPILALQIYNYLWSADVIYRELTSSASSNVRFLEKRLAMDFDAILYQQTWMFINDDVQRYMTYGDRMTDVQRYILTTSISKQIALVNHNYSLINQFILYYPTLDVSITRGYRNNRQNEYTNIMPISQMTEFGNLYTFGHASFAYENGKYCLQSGRSTSIHSPYLSAKAILSQEALTDLLRAHDAASTQKVFLLHWPSSTFVTSHAGNEALGEELLATLSYAHEGTVRMNSISFQGHSYTAFMTDLPAYNLSIVQLVDNQMLYAIPSRLRTLIFVMIALILGLTAIYYLEIHQMINKPVRTLIDCYQAAGEGNLAVKMKDHRIAEFSTLSTNFNAMIDKLRHLVQTNYQQTILLQQAQLHQLHSQIEPHFLYNTFFMLRHTIDADEIEEAEKICDYLGHYFQFITRETREFIDLKSEYDNTMNYVSIQTMRFSERLTMDIQPLPQALEQTIVPILILQPLIENAIEHGMPPTNAIIRLRFVEENEYTLLIRIEDNGTHLTDDQVSSMGFENRDVEKNRGIHALENIHTRLFLHYGTRYGLRFKRSQLGGLCVEMRLNPLAHPQTPEGRMDHVL